MAFSPTKNIISQHILECKNFFQQISEKVEEVNQSNIFLYYVIEKLIFLQIHNILENHSQPAKRAYPLYLWPRSKVWIQAYEASIQTAATKVTDIGDRLSLLASVSFYKSEVT